MTRDQAWVLVQEKVKGGFLRNHLLASEAIMCALARKFKEDEELWGLTGLVHDIDWELTESTPEQHSLVGAQWLAEVGFPAEIVEAVRVHNHMHGIEPKTLLEKSLWCAEELTGLIVACALVQPDKKLSSVKPESVMKKFKTQSFAKGVNREIIAKCQEMIGLTLEELIDIELKAMQEMATDIGL
ncbi:MAG TPA: phosphohydrolase [Candidatus Veblenbacteria bacterium]|uniref:Phosphohydrolase n=1 Tax=Candidatus Veblenbacteria bacterium RIFOXYC2_FULL_42_11 TaxID=1802428 RepID=A0A1G2Q923_9BACT|nr:MAG: phosphohydrolase [Candidatus Veblenbacteria bacterium RIFOXYC2_FULL_42_11]HCX38745.1 phosphohydrolase [Candidatus Veblenbacteria bacterium]